MMSTVLCVPLPDFLQLIGILDKDLNAKLHPCLSQVDVEARDFSTSDSLFHSLKSGEYGN